MPKNTKQTKQNKNNLANSKDYFFFDIINNAMSVIFERAKQNKETIEKRNAEQEEKAKECIREKYSDEWFVDDAIAELCGFRFPNSFSEISVGDKIKILSKNNIAGVFVDATVSQIVSDKVLKIKEDYFGRTIFSQRFFVFVQYKNDLILKLEQLVKQYEECEN